MGKFNFRTQAKIQHKGGIGMKYITEFYHCIECGKVIEDSSDIEKVEKLREVIIGRVKNKKLIVYLCNNCFKKEVGG